MNMKAYETSEVSEKKITGYQWKTLWSSTVGYAMDGLDMMILAYTLPLIIAFLALTKRKRKPFNYYIAWSCNWWNCIWGNGG
ncbi:hypothetical protein AAHH67_04365 [Niallia circulans]